MIGDITITLNADEYATLLIMNGYAAGAAFKENNKKLAYAFLRLANAINKDNPRWTPYDVPGDTCHPAAP